jgi:carboxymethylenebutenolidase
MVVLVLHEANGLMASDRLTADEIAAMGYVTIAPDMVSGHGPNGGDVESFTLAAPVSQTLSHLTDETVNADINAIADYAARLQGSNGSLAIVGLSWGGGAAFRYVTSQHRPDVKGIFVFYDVGPPRETQKLASSSTAISVDGITVPVYGFYPTLDKRTMLGLPSTKDAMAAAGKFFDPVVYNDADHGYMRVAEDPSNNNPADVQAEKDSLRLLKVELAKLK